MNNHRNQNTCCLIGIDCRSGRITQGNTFACMLPLVHARSDPHTEIKKKEYRDKGGLLFKKFGEEL